MRIKLPSCVGLWLPRLGLRFDFISDVLQHQSQQLSRLFAIQSDASGRIFAGICSRLGCIRPTNIFTQRCRIWISRWQQEKIRFRLRLLKYKMIYTPHLLHRRWSMFFGQQLNLNIIVITLWTLLLLIMKTTSMHHRNHGNTQDFN